MRNREKGSIEMLTLGLLAALIVVLAIPVVTGSKKPLPGLSEQAATEIVQPLSVVVTPQATP